MKNGQTLSAMLLALLAWPGGSILDAAGTDRLGDPLPPGAVQRFGTTRLRYQYGIRDAAYAWDGKIALVVYGRALDVWDLERGKRLDSQRVSDKGRELRLVAPSRRGPRALVADVDGTVFEWDYRKCRTIHRFATERKRLGTLCYSMDEQRVLTLDLATSQVEEWEKASGRRLAVIDPGKRKYSCAVYGPDDHTVFIGSADYQGDCPNVFHYDLRNGKLLKGLLPGKFVGVYALDLSPDRHRLLARLRYTATTEWRVSDYKVLDRGFRAPGRPGPSACYPGDKRRLLTGSRDGTVRVWDRHTQETVRKWTPHRGWVRRIRVSPDGKWALSYGDGHLLADVNIATGKPRLPWTRHTARVNAVAFAPGGNVAVTGAGDRTVCVWDATAGRGLRTIRTNSAVAAVAVSPDGERVLTGLTNGEVREYALESGALIHTLRGHSGTVHAVAYIAGDQAISAGDDGTLRLWRLDSGEETGIMTGHLGGILTLALSSDHTHAVTGGRDCTVREWDIAAGRLLHTVLAHRGEVWTVAFSPNDRRVLTACRSGEIAEWDRATWTSLHLCRGGPRACTACYLPGGTEIAVAGTDGKITVLDPRTNRKLHIFSGHGGRVGALAADPKHARFLSGSDDTTALLWRLSEQVRFSDPE